jgi:RNA polymerase sigma-70 factor (ECF subfamily)
MEEGLIEQAQSGDQEAFRQLVSMYSSLLHRTARVLLNDPLSAEDAVQEAWLDVWKGLSSFQLGRPFRPWLLTVVANRCRKHLRVTRLPSVPLDNCLGQTLVAPQDQKNMALQSVESPELEAALTELSVEQQNILALRFFAELELEEIAQLKRLPLGTVKSRLYRAIESLRINLDAKRNIP